jgi:hypothetical protein
MIASGVKPGNAARQQQLPDNAIEAVRQYQADLCNSPRLPNRSA